MTGQPIIVFDALCPLCSANAQFILKHDRRAVFRIAAIQGRTGADLCRRFKIDPTDPATFLLITDSRAPTNSDAVIAVLAELGSPWRAARLLKIIPQRARDRLYHWVARNRYRLFGRRATCWVPDPADAKRIL